MTKKSIIKKGTAALLLGAMLMSSNGVVLAKDLKNSAVNSTGDYNQANKDEHFNAQLDSLVKSGTITQQQKDKILSYMEKKKAERKAEFEKVKSMSETERKDYFEKMKSQSKPDMFRELVDQKVLTQDQADAVKAQLPHHKDDRGRGFRNQLDSFVKSGTITEEQKVKIIEYMQMRKADMFKELVDQKIITQQQADTMKKQMMEHRQQPSNNNPNNNKTQ
jgi:Tfp pilus assembly protein PilP